MTRADLIAQIKTWRDTGRWAGTAEHQQKWNQVLATLGEAVPEQPMPVETIRYRAERWPESHWATVAAFIEANPDVVMEPTALKEDPVLDLAEEIYQDYRADAANREHHQQSSILEVLGFKDWLIGGLGGYLDADTPARRAKVLAALAGKPYHARLTAFLADHGWRFPRRHLPERIAPLKSFCYVALGAITWGLEETKDRDFQFHRQYDRLFLRVMDGGEEVAAVTSSTYSNTTPLESLGLTDDDYRIFVGCEGEEAWKGSGPSPAGTGFPRRTSRPFDWAIIDGEWTDISSQTDRDWDGEWSGGAE